MSSRRAFNISPSMIHLQAFYWLKQFAEGSILLDTALDSIEFTLGSNFESDQWMNLTHCIVMEPDCWPAIEKIFMQELGIVGSSSVFEPLLPELHSQPSRVSTMSDTQESSSSTEARVSPPSVSGIQESSSSTARAPLPSALTPSDVPWNNPMIPLVAVPLLKDPSALRLMMDWAQDKIGFSELDDRMRAYGPRYIPKEWKVLIDEVFMLSDPGVESTSSPSLVIERAMESQGISLSAAPPVPSFWASTRSTSSSQSATRRRRKSCGVTQNKRHKLNSSIFLDIDAEDEGEEDEGEEEEEDEEGRRNYGPQQVGPSGKGSYLWTIDTLCERFHHGAWETTVSNDPLVTQLPTSIFPPPCNNIYIVEFYSASARTFTFEYIKMQGFEVMTLPWLPHRLYVEASCPLEVQRSLPPSHCRSHKEIVLLPPQEGMLILVYKALQVLPTRNWVRIKQSAYKGDIGYIEESTESEAVVLVAPHQLPYDLPEESGKRMRFDVELARLTDLDFVPILSPSGAEIGYSCSGQQFVHGLLRLTLLVNTLELVELPHPNDIRFHVAAGIDPSFVEETLNIFSSQFWREHDSVEIQEGDLRGKRGVLADVDLHKRSAVVLCDGDAFGCNLQELRRVFKIGDTVEVIAGPFCRETGYVVALHERTLVLVVMQPDKTSDNIEVSKFVVQSQLPEHILSLGPEDNEPRLVHPLPGDEALPGDLVRTHCGPYTGRTGIIEWISSDGKVWVFMHGKGKGKEDVLADEENPAPSQTVVAMNVSDLHIEQPPNTLTFTKDKGYNVAVGDTVEVVRGQWHDSQGIVKAVDLTKASLDIVRPTDRVQINVPITFSCKIMERFEHGLSKFVGRDVWVIVGNKKGSRAMLRTIGRMSSWIGVTPPPSPGPSNAGLSDAWTITPADITQTQTPDYGNVPWLFEPNFCDFKSFHLGFNVSVGFTQVSLGKCVVRMVCPDRFTGSAIQHLTIPARYLMPANPTGKNQLCLILKGPQAGQVVHIKKCQRTSKSVVMEDVFCLNSIDGLTFYQDNYIFLLRNLLWLAPIDDGLEGFMQLSLPFIIVGWRYTKVLLLSPNMGLVHSRFAGVLSSQGQDLALGSPPNISHMASLVEVTQKRKFCEDRDSALGPPLKISRGTSLTIQTSAVNIQPISPVPPVIASLKRKASEDQDLALARPAKIPRIPSLVDPVNLPPIGSSCFIWWLPNELLAHITTLLPRNSLLALTQACQLLREITAPHFFALLGFDTPQSNYLSLDDDGCEGLLVWQQTEAFVVLNSLCFSISQMTTDYHLWQGGPSSAPTSVLRARQTDPFILVPAGKHPRVRMQGIDLLRLGMGKRATGLTSAQWTSFLKDLRFRYLRSLEVEATCPVRSLVEFLSVHQVETLTIISVAARHSSPPRSPLRRTRPPTLLSSLTKLDGSPPHILSFLHYAHIPDTLEYLGVRLGASSFTDCFLSDVLSCTEHLPGVASLCMVVAELPGNQGPLFVYEELQI
ncbi:hypothetical protein F5141DRAFT_1063453 [Pisolithus sp. B1]|nr:hypothetical protein F5141DRAFT_1063453 [Pisolithus sp. B1]